MILLDMKTVMVEYKNGGIMTEIFIFKDLIDKIHIWSSIITMIASLVLTALSILLIYFNGAIRADKIKKENEEKCSLDYLIVTVSRYFNYLINIRKAVVNKFHYTEDFINNPNDKTKLKRAFSTISMIPNFQIDLSKYDFTIKTQPSIVDDIITYQQTYQEIINCKDHINSISKGCVNINTPQEVIIKTAKEMLEPEYDLYALNVLISIAIVTLNRILESINKFKIINNHKNSLGMRISDEARQELNAAILFLDSIGNYRWRECLNDLEPIKQKGWFVKFYQWIFSVTNKNNHKVVCILGIKIKKRLKEKELNKTLAEIKDLLSNHSNEFKQVHNDVFDLTQVFNVLWNEIHKADKDEEQEDDN